MEAVIDNI